MSATCLISRMEPTVINCFPLWFAMLQCGLYALALVYLRSLGQ